MANLFEYVVEETKGERTVEYMINVYELPSMKKAKDPASGKPAALRADSVRDFEWSPRGDVLAYYGLDVDPGKDDDPMKPCSGVVAVVDVPTRTILRSKNHVNVAHIRLEWAKSGEFLTSIARCTMQMAAQKKKEGQEFVPQMKRYKLKNTVVEVFRVLEKGCPFEHMELQVDVHALKWEPTPDSRRFCMIYGELPFPDMGVYTLSPPDADGLVLMEQTCHLERKKANHIFWAPQGGVLLLAAYVANRFENEDLANLMNGQLEFYDVDEARSMASRECYRCNYVQWDPSGRTVTTAVCQQYGNSGHYIYSMDNGYMHWTYMGDALGTDMVSKEAFYQFLWRPRPQSLLTADAQKKVIKKLRKFERRFERADREKQRAKDTRAKIKAHAQRERMRAIRERARLRLQEERAQRLALYDDGYDSEDDANYVTEVVTVHTKVVDRKEEVIN